jgi:hypothetical protein
MLADGSRTRMLRRSTSPAAIITMMSLVLAQGPAFASAPASATTAAPDSSAERSAVRVQVAVDPAFDPELATELATRVEATLAAAGLDVTDSAAIVVGAVVGPPPADGAGLAYELRVLGGGEPYHHEHTCEGCSAPALVDDAAKEVAALVPRLRESLERVAAASAVAPEPVVQPAAPPAPSVDREAARIQVLELAGALTFGLGLGGVLGAAAELGYARATDRKGIEQAPGVWTAGYVMLGVSSAATLAGIGVLAAMGVARKQHGRKLAAGPHVGAHVTGFAISGRF